MANTQIAAVRLAKALGHYGPMATKQLAYQMRINGVPATMATIQRAAKLHNALGNGTKIWCKAGYGYKNPTMWHIGKD